MTTRITEEEAREGILPTEPGYYVPNSEGRAPEYIPGQRLFRAEPWGTGIRWAEIALGNPADEEAIKAMVKEYGWTLTRLAVEQEEPGGEEPEEAEDLDPRKPGVWVTFFTSEPPIGFWPTEVEALRQAVERGARVEFYPYGEA